MKKSNKKSDKKETKKVESTKELKTKTKPTLNDMNKAKEANKVHIGKLARIIPMLGEKPIEVGIRGIMCDKRVCLAYFRVQDQNGQVYHKRIGSNDIEILDQLAPKAKKDLEREKAKKEANIAKLEAKIAKYETKIKVWQKELKELNK